MYKLCLRKLGILNFIKDIKIHKIITPLAYYYRQDSYQNISKVEAVGLNKNSDYYYQIKKTTALRTSTPENGLAWLVTHPDRFVYGVGDMNKNVYTNDSWRPFGVCVALGITCVRINETRLYIVLLLVYINFMKFLCHKKSTDDPSKCLVFYTK